uniref:B box-type domain-containing protein n=1 Tax=Leptobrachium leishanense TaxID=445787 RepID=A0A8C5PSW9_9ANUR
ARTMASVDLTPELTCSFCLNIFTDPVTVPCGHSFCRTLESFQSNKKCSVHKKVLEYYCCEDATCICVSCRLDGEHRGHQVETLNEASEKKKEKMRNILQKLTSQREETKERVQNLEVVKRQVRGKTAGVTERFTPLIRDIGEQLEDLKKQVLGEISRQAAQVSLPISDLIQQLEIKKEELTRKMGDIKELCNMTNPLTVLQEQESDRRPSNPLLRSLHRYRAAEGPRVRRPQMI